MCMVKTIQIDNRTIRVAEIKQKYIKNVIDAARKCSFIDRVVLFGSCIEERCKDSSDIDIAVFGSQTPYRALSSKKYESFARQLYAFDNHVQSYDILYFKTGSKEDSPIMADISRGVVLYER
ncbi:MAG: nucleotidyltransferase domain-containing protein [Succiniclasticum sp.]|uniref:nucleotidyltransferase domain-containing protein n=1 Tax=Succiniclasticum sp. TaxID=2775030 RepID=UPI002A90C90C|nr:nucleotidyltransferase domain-containing protein [Succiniclasticum sp.]MDY6290293.1 nucleotidyltransferase domain-containing protein [Succiniclasticum sp.]